MPDPNSSQPTHGARQQPSRKVFDVMRPGRAPVSATSRPVIVGHKPQVKDPMMQKPLHVVDDAANALHMPDDPLLTPGNPNKPADLTQPTQAVSVAPEQVAKPAPTSQEQTAMPAENPTLTHFTPVEPTVPEPAPQALAPEAAVPTSAPMQAAQPEVPEPTAPASAPEQRDVAFDDEAKGDLAALAVQGITEIDDGNAVGTPEQSASQPGGITDNTNEEPAATSAQPAHAYQAPLPKFEDLKDEDLPSASDMGHVAQSDLLAPEPTPASEKPAKPAKSKAGKKRAWLWVLTIFLLLVLAAVVIDILLDGGFITIQHVPHTHFF